MSPFRPPQWNQPLLTSVSVKSPAPGGTPGREESQETTYYFDAVIRANHFGEVRATEHPIQNSASITDHAYVLPARLALEIGMSDAMDRYSRGVYTSDKSKSVSAFVTFTKWKDDCAPMTVATRLKTYKNMLVESVRAEDDNRTRHGLRAVIYFRELMLGTVTTRTVSARPDQSTSSTDEGTKQPEPVPKDLQPYLDAINGH